MSSDCGQAQCEVSTSVLTLQGPLNRLKTVVLVGSGVRHLLIPSACLSLGDDSKGMSPFKEAGTRSEWILNLLSLRIGLL